MDILFDHICVVLLVSFTFTFFSCFLFLLDMHEDINLLWFMVFCGFFIDHGSM